MIINEKNRNKKLTNNILSLAQEASEAKKENNNVINATAGMLFGDDNKLYTFEAVKCAMRNLSNESMFKYSDTCGSSRFSEAIIEWVFGEELELFKSHYLKVVATPGGSGAIALTFSTYMNKGDKVLLPKVMWETYITYAHERELSYLTYDLYDDFGKFNISSIKECIDQLNNQENVVLVINDPCQNPTGFCMTDEDYDNLIKLLNSYNRNIVLLMDMAYFDYYSSNGSIIRKRYSK
jgi:aspartate/tyrosine/aromatic aminotransferase